MKGDFSRLPAPRGPWSGVWMQQGRVQLDQDWNEQRALEAEHARAALRDLVGSGGAPAGDPGFRVRARGGIHCGGETVLQAEVELASPGGEVTVEVRVVVEQGRRGGVLVEVEGWFVLAVDDGGCPSFRTASGDGAAVLSPEPLPPGTPVLVSAAYDGRVAVLHLDGRPVAAVPMRRTETPPPAGPLRIGGAAGAGGTVQNGFGGTLDEVRLWSHARTPAQVREAAARTLTGLEQGLAAYFPLDEGVGRGARDAASGRHAHAVREPRWAPHALMLGSGRMYVDGVPCTAPREVPFDAQPDLPGAHPLAPGRHLVYLDVWERYVGAAEDPALREVALGGLDTTGRTRTVWQARALPLEPGEDWRDALLGLRRGRMRAALAVRRVVPGAPASGNRLYRVEVHGSGGLYGWPRLPGHTERAARVTAVESASGGGGTLTVHTDGPGFEALVPGARVEIFTRATDGEGRAGTLAHVTGTDPARRQLTVDALPPGLALGDEPRVRAVATFLWSEDNAWRAWPVRHLDRASGRAVLEDVGPEGVPLLPGDVVELSDERTVLLARPGLLFTVRHVDPHAETVTLQAAAPWPALEGGGRMLLRRWTRGRGAPADALPARADQWTGLGDGVEVRFEGTAFRTSDYWTIPMRMAVHGGLEWPQAGTRPAALPPQGIEHRYAALATVVVHPHGGDSHRHRIEVTDHRRIFQPLVSFADPADGGAVHHHHHHHHHGHGDDDGVEVTVRGDDSGARVEVGVRGGEDGDDAVDVRVDAPGGGPDVRVVTHEDADGHDDVRITIGDDDGDGYHGHHGVRGDDADRRRHGHGDHDDGHDDHDHPDHHGYHDHHHHHDHGHDEGRGDASVAVELTEGGGEQVSVAVEEDGETVEVDVHARGRGGDDEDVRVVVHTQSSVPAGFWIFGETDAAPEGFGSTGARFVLPEAAPEWRPRRPLRDPRPGRVHCAALDGAVFALGEGTREVFRYDPSVDAWRVETLLADAWRGYAVGVLDGRIHLVGGRDGRDRMVDWHRAYHPRTGQWETRAPLPGPRCEMGAAALQGVLYAAGGLRPLLSMTTAAMDAYDPGADAWTGCRRMGHGRANPGVAAAAGRLYVIGGRQPGLGHGRPSGHAESYDPASGRWKELDDVPTPRLDAALAEMDGVLYLVGGDAGAGPTGLAQCYTPGGGWGGGPEMETARTRLGLAAFSGRLFAVGGATGEIATGAVEECRLFFDLHGFRKE
ncbi:MAG TPA: DUF6519 domain-containing protein [Longimicrobium sp.]|nr:DUF6519 domain-containing protein [Longimicrobium sp.]